MVAALCYVQNILNGPVARAIMAVAVVGVGWLFLLGGASWTTVLMFTVASSLVFGGIELANIISGNSLSCQVISKAKEKYEEIVYNKGICGINRIPIYKSGQTWLACSMDNINNVPANVSSSVANHCITTVDNNTYLDTAYDPRTMVYKTVVLSSCQDGYMKRDPNIYLEYACNKDKNDIGYFTGHSANENNMKAGECVQACSASSISSTLNRNNLQAIYNNEGGYSLLNGWSQDFSNGTYYAAGTKLAVECKNGYMAYLRNADGTETPCTGGNCSGNIECGRDDELGIFGPSIFCRRACSSTPYKDIDVNVKKFGRYDDEIYSEITEANPLFIENNKVIIKECAAGYALEYGKEGLILDCKESEWWADKGGSKCYKTCSKSAIADALTGDSWLGCDADGKCNRDISNQEIFALGETIQATGRCSTGYSISGDGEDYAKYVCGPQGAWEEIGGRSCKPNCRTADYENNNLPGAAYTTLWKNLKTNSTAKELTIENGTKINAHQCVNSYNVSPDNPTIYICKNGKFEYYGGPSDEYCRQGCLFKDLKQLPYVDVDEKYDLTDSVALWVQSSGTAGLSLTVEENGKKEYKSKIDMNKAADYNRYAHLNDYYKIFECNSGYDTATHIEDSVLVAQCVAGGKWNIVANNWNACRAAPRCYEYLNATGNTITTNLEIDTKNDSIVQFVLIGGPGGGNRNHAGGFGGLSCGSMLITPSQSRTIAVTVGGGGNPGDTNTGTGGYNGGGDGGKVIGASCSATTYRGGSGGGGASDIRYGGNSLADRIIVAAGGGGASGQDSAAGLVLTGYRGGGEVGEGGDSSTPNGIGGSSDKTSYPSHANNMFLTEGVEGFGGHGTVYNSTVDSCFSGGGGGGGGWFGGSGGVGGGGGGSGYVSPDHFLPDTIVTKTLENGPTTSGLIRICHGDWYRQTNPCDLDPEDPETWKVNGGITNNKKECLAPAASKRDVTEPSRICSAASLRTFMANNHLHLPDALSSKLPATYYRDMTIRQACQDGYVIRDAGDKTAVEIKCRGNNSWSLESGRCTRQACYEYNFIGAREKVTIEAGAEDLTLMTWGGQGGGTNNTGAQGGYAKVAWIGEITTAREFGVEVGNRGLRDEFGTGGGGRGVWSGTTHRGGGATSISISEGNSTCNGNDPRILVVGGGGGGNSGGVGGGANLAGGNGSNANGAKGASITAGGAGAGGQAALNGSCGQGGNNDVSEGFGGGGGYYGGGAGINGGDAGGGSGYANTNMVQVKSTVSGKKSGAGFARICVGGHPACNDETGTRNTACELKTYSCSNTQNAIVNNTGGVDLHINYPTSGTTSAGVSVIYGCATGYSGSVILGCAMDRWKVLRGICYKNCSALPANPTGGTWSGNLTHNSTATLTCGSGYTISGNTSVVCDSGSWTPAPGTCYRNCTSPTAITGGSWSSNAANHGNSVTASCNDGYTKSGSRTATCSNGGWIYSGTITCYKNCTMPANPTGGSWSGSLTHNSTITLTCGSGYISSGNTSLKCNNGSWNVTPGTCNPANCTMPTNPTGGSWSGNTTNGSTITMTCNSGYTLSGTRTATCTNGSWTYSGTAVCVQGGCSGRPTTIAGSNLCNSTSCTYGMSSSGQFVNGVKYNYSWPSSLDTNTISTNGTIIDAYCSTDYTETSDGGDCTVADCGGSVWTHYYYCKDGVWKRVGTCRK